MLSKWVLVAIDDNATASGVYDVYTKNVKFTITNGSTTRSLYGLQAIQIRVLGVVPLSDNKTVIAQCFTKPQLEIIKCIKDIKRDKIRYNFGSYPDLAYEVSTRRSIPDIIADSFKRPDDNFSLEGNKMCIVGRDFSTYRYDYIIEDRQKFDKAVTKYCIMRNKQ